MANGRTVSIRLILLIGEDVVEFLYERIAPVECLLLWNLSRYDDERLTFKVNDAQCPGGVVWRTPAAVPWWYRIIILTLSPSAWCGWLWSVHLCDQVFRKDQAGADESAVAMQQQQNWMDYIKAGR